MMLVSRIILIMVNLVIWPDQQYFIEQYHQNNTHLGHPLDICCILIISIQQDITVIIVIHATTYMEVISMIMNMTIIMITVNHSLQNFYFWKSKDSVRLVQKKIWIHWWKLYRYYIFHSVCTSCWSSRWYISSSRSCRFYR